MNKLVTAAMVGGAALAVGVLPAAASAATPPVPPTPIAPPAAPATHPSHTHVPLPPGHVSHAHRHAPGGHGTGTHRSGKAKGKGKAARHKPSRGKAGAPGTGKTGGGKPSTGKAPGGQPGQPGSVVKGKPAGYLFGPHTPMIIGGKDATDAPWAAQVSWDGMGFECSGSVIASQWVLTAAHCVNPDGMTVQVGSTHLDEGTKVTVDDSQVDPAGDMALLHLADPVTVTPAPLADADPEVGSVNQIYGWGKTAPDSGPSPRLKVARVKVTGLDCADADHGKAICSTGVNGSAFNGDSGGPEMADGVEVGVCSTGDDQSKTQQYASVAANRDWIHQVATV